jgi:outer membrane protein assembly factor BamA
LQRSPHHLFALFSLLAAAVLLASPAARGQEPQPTRSELTLVPFVGGDSDVGFGGGFIASWARVGERYQPYLARVEAGTTATFRKTSERFEMPYLDSYFLIDLPHVLLDRLHLRLRISHTQEATLKYYGLGNASRVEASRPVEYLRHERSHPTLDVRGEYWLTRVFKLTWGAAYTQNWFSVLDDTRLAEDMRAGSPLVRRLLGSAEPHAVMTFSQGVAWDDRDDEVNPHSGQLHALRVDLSPGGYAGFPYRWGRANANFRGYVPLLPRRLTFAARLITDALFGDAPFYELPRYDSTSAIGGVNGVRGIPAQRYYGKLKILSNAELRSQLFDFRLFGKSNSFGVTGFVDAGRVWADYQAAPELDGTGLGLKYGVGGGLRIAAGESFVLRFDVAGSTQSEGLSAYLASGHIF